MKFCLVADDSEVIRKVARHILEEISFIPIEAADGRQAMERCRNDMPDAILLDWKMPEMDGIDVITALRSEPDGDHPYVLYCASELDAKAINRALDSGASDYLLKPFDGEEISEKFRQAGLI